MDRLCVWITVLVTVVFLVNWTLGESENSPTRKRHASRSHKIRSLTAGRNRRQLDFRLPINRNAFGFNARTAYENWKECNEDPNCDPRSLEDWWMLYPYGKKVLDDELMGAINRETQINLGFDCPYYGFRFNYTQVSPNGFVSFAFPLVNQPPYTFPNPRWPIERDHSFIAPFYAETAFQYVGNVKISNVWFRSVHRPRVENPAWLSSYEQGSGNNFGSGGNQASNGGFGAGGFETPNIGRKKRQIPGSNMIGNVIDIELLDNITRDIQAGYNGATGFRAEYAVVVTWERVAFGGARKAVDVSQFDQVLQWQNTFQLVLATDQIRTFAMFNYARLNWTTSNAAGGLDGKGGFQPALVGFNGGNGTGFTKLPYSGEGRVWQLSYFTNVLVPGRWVYRVDEVIIPGGCSNASVGSIVTSPPWGPMIGETTVNVTGPCLRPNDFVKVTFDEWPVDCKRLNRIKAQCKMPIFHKTGLMALRMSSDGGQSYPFIGWFYVLPTDRTPPGVKLQDSVEDPRNRWFSPDANQLTLAWGALNLTNDYSARVDINLFGYYEDAFRSHFEKIDAIATGQPNNGRYSFAPKTLSRNPLIDNAYKHYQFGLVQIALSNDPNHGVQWSRITPFSFYHKPYWQSHYGSNWATDMCIDWFEYDGRRENFFRHLPPCPCRIEQALLDLGRYMPLFDCDMDGNGACTFHKGAKHCIQSVQATFTGAGQQCCYNYEGYLMFSDDWEPTGDLSKYYQPGTPVRGHAYGSPPFTRQPPRIPSFSIYTNDLMPYYMCCQYADHCEFYYWRRQSHGCQGYQPPGAAYIFGQSHVRTFDGLEYTFPGKGYYVFAMSEDPQHQLMVQVRLEQPDPTLWRENVNATVVTGITVRENNSDVVSIFPRKSFRRWRYKTDVYVNGIRRFFDKPHWKYQQFTGVSLRNPQLNMNQSEIIILLDSGAALRVSESYGMLDVMIMLTASFNSSCDQADLYNGEQSLQRLTGNRRPCYNVRGLAGAWNGDVTDDLMLLDGTVVGVSRDTYNEATTRDIYERFGMQWRVDPTNPRIGPVLFKDQFKPLYNPLLFASKDYMPKFYVDQVPRNAAMIMTTEQVRSTCMGQPQCEYDYIMTGRREIALTSLSYRTRFIELQRSGSKRLVSCGPLYKLPGVTKTPPSKNYLDGDVVTFSCKPAYFIHGTPERTCINGTWTSGWWVWCRDRSLEWALKWLTGLLVALFVVLIIILVFCCLWRRRKRLNDGRVYRTGEPIKYTPGKAGEKSNVSSFEKEPGRVGLAGNGYNSGAGYNTDVGYKPVPAYDSGTAI